MTKSELFTKAHQIAKATVAMVGDYMIAFSLALKSLYRASNADKLIAAGLKVWKGKRIYINPADRMKVFGLGDIAITRANKVAWATDQNGDFIHHSDITGTIYLDVATDTLVGTELALAL